eukprot:CAMPEP_0178454374 /NCGR_PEP_ID=MMETSP0689_2-20121128/45325_1 /TAXON_ID=160604 /ORGANISM="Amphidinium massartii, Strain CS-259" /LENGTH=140 /DNA_ID=CAMNT_0020080305 /DNA_START=527 /DNA_END=947 /DNA_ORIENTATION=+
MPLLQPGAQQLELGPAANMCYVARIRPPEMVLLARPATCEASTLGGSKTKSTKAAAALRSQGCSGQTQFEGVPSQAASRLAELVTCAPAVEHGETSPPLDFEFRKGVGEVEMLSSHPLEFGRVAALARLPKRTQGCRAAA